MATAVAALPGQGLLGESQRLFSEQARAKRQELIETGQCDPFTVINFNPIPSGLEGELARYRIPSPDDTRLPKDVARISLEWEGKERIGHALTLREPHIYGRMVNASAFQGDKASAIPERTVMYYLPIGIAYTFLEHFSPIFVTKDDKRATPPPKDARRIYGILAFKGDLHTLQQELMKLRSPATADKAMIHVPVARIQNVGKVSQRFYSTVEFSLAEYLRQMFAGQLRFADATITRAQQKYSETESIKDISESDRVWRRWAIRMGYAPPPKPGMKDWLNEMLTLDTDVEAKPAVELRKCQACRTPEPEPGTPFCPKCAAPIDTFDTFMRGFPVAEAWLMALKGEERELALEEMARRKDGFETGKPAGKAAKKAKAAAAAEAESDGSPTALPGEEEEQ